MISLSEVKIAITEMSFEINFRPTTEAMELNQVVSKCFQLTGLQKVYALYTTMLAWFFCIPRILYVEILIGNW